jgi:hypothetical protein
VRLALDRASPLSSSARHPTPRHDHTLAGRHYSVCPNRHTTAPSPPAISCQLGPAGLPPRAA